MATKASAAAASEEPIENLEPFEKLIERLDGVVKRLESGELSLEQALAAYEQGIGLVRKAQARLDQMDRRLEELKGDGSTAPLTLEGDDNGA